MDQGFVQFVCQLYVPIPHMLVTSCPRTYGMCLAPIGAFGTIRLGTGDSLRWSRFGTSVLWVDSHTVGLAIMLVRQLRSGN
jgi:hypothetical protein